MHGIVQAIKLRKGKSAYNPWTHISHKELIYLLQKFIIPRRKILLHMILWEGLVGVNHHTIPTSTHKEGNQRTHHASNLSHNGYHTCMLRDLQTSTQVFLKFTTTQLAQLQYHYLHISKQSSSIKLLLVFITLIRKFLLVLNT